VGLFDDSEDEISGPLSPPPFFSPGVITLFPLQSLEESFLGLFPNPLNKASSPLQPVSDFPSATIFASQKFSSDFAGAEPSSGIAALVDAFGFIPSG